MTKNQNGRTHEPNLRELTAQLDDLKELAIVKDQALRELLLEREHRYEDRFRAMEAGTAAAMLAMEKQTASSFLASEKAIIKAETAQTDYNVRSNEFRGQLDDQAKRLMPRLEVDARFSGIEEKITDLKKEITGLRESRSVMEGGNATKEESWDQMKWMVGIAITIAATLISFAILLTKFQPTVAQVIK